jgi:hypothetical protein
MAMKIPLTAEARRPQRLRREEEEKRRKGSPLSFPRALR